MLLSFEDVFAQEKSLAGFNDVETPCDHIFAPGSSPSRSLSYLDQEQWLDKGLSLHTSAKQHSWAAIEGQDGLVKWNEIVPQRSISRSRKTPYLLETGRLRLSDKRDLVPSEIRAIAHRLIKNESVVYFPDNCRLIYENLMPSTGQQPLVCDETIEDSVITAFDTIQVLVNGRHIYRLLLRFANIHLVQVIDFYRAAAAKDRVEGSAAASGNVIVPLL